MLCINTRLYGSGRGNRSCRLCRTGRFSWTYRSHGSYRTSGLSGSGWRSRSYRASGCRRSYRPHRSSGRCWRHRPHWTSGRRWCHWSYRTSGCRWRDRAHRTSGRRWRDRAHRTSGCCRCNWPHWSSGRRWCHRSYRTSGCCWRDRPHWSSGCRWHNWSHRSSGYCWCYRSHWSSGHCWPCRCNWPHRSYRACRCDWSCWRHRPRRCYRSHWPYGPAGNEGATGTAATLSVGTVTTGDPGTDAKVTNSGTSQNAILDFTIPQGPTGSTPPLSLLSAYSSPTQSGASGDPLEFDRNALSYGTDISHTAGSSDFTINQPGVYSVQFHGVLSPADSDSFPANIVTSLESDGSIVPGASVPYNFQSAGDSTPPVLLRSSGCL